MKEISKASEKIKKLIDTERMSNDFIIQAKKTL